MRLPPRRRSVLRASAQYLQRPPSKCARLWCGPCDSARPAKRRNRPGRSSRMGRVIEQAFCPSGTRCSQNHLPRWLALLEEQQVRPGRGVGAEDRARQPDAGVQITLLHQAFLESGLDTLAEPRTGWQDHGGPAAGVSTSQMMRVRNRPGSRAHGSASGSWTRRRPLPFRRKGDWSE